MLTTSSNTLEIRKSTAQEIQKLVENNQFNEATKRLMDFVADFGTNKVSKRDATHIRRRFTALRDEKRRFPERDFTDKETNLSDGILDLVELILEYSELPLLPSKEIDNFKDNIFQKNN